MSNAKAYLLNDGEDWFVHVAGYYSDFTLYADGQPAERIEDAAVRERWWRIDHQPERLEMVGGPTKKTVGYRLPEGVTLSDHPAELTPEEWRERFIDEDYETSDIGKLYEAVVEDVAPKREPLDVPTIVLEGAPPPNDGLIWVAELPYELRERREYLHLFPGYFANDFREVLAKRLEERACVQHVFKHQPGPLEVSVRVHYEPTVWWPKKNARGRVTKARGTHGYVSHDLKINAPIRVQGRNREEALKAWNEQMDEFIEAVEEAAHVVPCGHCNGRGWRERSGEGER